MSAAPRERPVFLGLLPWPERVQVARALRTETVGELAFPDPAEAEHINAADLLGSLLAASLAALLVKHRNGIYRRLWEAENVDEDADGIPDLYQRRTDEPSTGAPGDD
jgi:NhaA family Na+:H+ antiporter